MTACKLIPVAVIGVLVTMSCSQKVEEKTQARQGAPREFGKTPSGETIFLYTLKNTKNAEATISTYGGVVTSLKVPDRTGKFEDVVLGFDDFQGYLNNKPYFGALIGRYGNRIGHARFSLDGKVYNLAKNDGDNTLHGGLHGFDKAVWKADAYGDASVELKYVSKDGEENFPGTLTATVTYTLTDNNELKIEYAATTDNDTVVNLTNHSYFNLAGGGQGDVSQHQVMIHADRLTPVDKGLIPTGEFRAVAGTPFDFRQAHAIGERIDAKDQQLVFAHGYDHNFVLNEPGNLSTVAARVTEPKSGRVMEVATTEPGLQFYTGNFLDGTIRGKGGNSYQKHAAFCMETQHFPDSPNRPEFPTTVLKPGPGYRSTTIYRFSTDSAK